MYDFVPSEGFLSFNFVTSAPLMLSLTLPVRSGGRRNKCLLGIAVMNLKRLNIQSVEALSLK